MAVASLLAFLGVPRALGAQDDPLVQLIAGTNAQREQHRLPAVRDDRTLDVFARSLAAAMAQRRYFGHTAPDGTSFVDRLHAAGVSFRWAAENIGEGTTVPQVQALFVASPDHLRNIVSPTARRMGGAVFPGPDGMLIVVEDFSD